MAPPRSRDDTGRWSLVSQPAYRAGKIPRPSMRLLRATGLIFLLMVPPSGGATLSGSVSLVADEDRRSDASNVVVWIEGAPRTGAASTHGGKDPQMIQSSKRFQPRVLAVA